jgi:SEC-C motif
VASGQWPAAILDPARYGEATVRELLDAAAGGLIGVDRRLLRSILERGESAVADVLAFSRAPSGKRRINLEPLLIDLFRHYGTPEALDFFIGVTGRSEDLDDSLMMAMLAFGGKAIDPLLRLYDQLGEESGSEVAFMLAGMRIRDPRVLNVLLERLEYDAADGALSLGLYGDPAAIPALRTMLAEIPESDPGLRHDIELAIEQCEAPPAEYQPEPFDIFEEYPERELPVVDVLDPADRLRLLSSAEAKTRAAAAHSFFNEELNAEARAALLKTAQSDPDAIVRGRAWESLADMTSDAAIRDAMVAVVNDPARETAERGGAAVGLYGVADQDDVRRALEALYEEGGAARAKALEAMWRSLWKPYARFFPRHLDDPDREIVRQAIRGAGYFQLTAEAGKIAGYFDREDEWADLREDALFAYALAMPGETTRGRIRGLLRKIDSLAKLSEEELDLVEFGLDERLRLRGLEPVFSGEAEEEEQPAEPPPAAPAAKVGRNDPCPCGSGKKYKKCCGA